MAKRKTKRAPKGTLTVRLSKDERIQVSTLPEASAAVLDYTAVNGLGASDWYDHRDVGLVTDAAGKPVARVSYNGRLWDPQDDTRELIFHRPQWPPRRE